MGGAVLCGMTSRQPISAGCRRRWMRMNAFYPVFVGVFGTQAVVHQLQAFSQLDQHPRGM